MTLKTINGKNYEELDQYVWNLRECCDAFESSTRDVWFKFNTHILHSDMSRDECFLEVLGRTEQEQKDAERKWHEEYERKEQEHKAKIPELTKEWIAKGHEVLDEKYWEEWNIIVPIRLGDLYKGMELDATVEILAILNSGTFEQAKKALDAQGHSGMSHGLVCCMLEYFHDKGKSFVSFVKNK